MATNCTVKPNKLPRKSMTKTHSSMCHWIKLLPPPLGWSTQYCIISSLQDKSIALWWQLSSWPHTDKKTWHANWNRYILTVEENYKTKICWANHYAMQGAVGATCTSIVCHEQQKAHLHCTCTCTHTYTHTRTHNPTWPTKYRTHCIPLTQ